MAIEVRYSAESVEQLRQLRAVDRAAILDEIESILAVNPTLTSKAKVKQLRQPAPTMFRLRVGDFRVFYDVDEPATVVNVIQVLSKSDAMKYLEKPQ